MTDLKSKVLEAIKEIPEGDKTYLPYADLMNKVIGCAMKVLNYYGPCYVEDVYQKGLETVLRNEGIPFTAKKRFRYIMKEN